MVGFSWEQFKVDLDELVVVECVYCGELMICFIDWLFIDFQCYEEEQFSWLQEGVIFDGGWVMGSSGLNLFEKVVFQVLFSYFVIVIL